MVKPKTMNFVALNIVLFLSCSSALAAGETKQNLAKAEAWKCFGRATRSLVSTTTESAETLLPAVLNRCQVEVAKWRHLMVIEINRSSNIMIETSIVETEAQIAGVFEKSVNPIVLAYIVETRARLNTANNENHAEVVSNTYGTGFLISSEGVVVTNAHVVENCKSIRLRKDNDESVAKAIRIEKKNDLALLQNKKNNSNPAKIHAGPNARVGNYVAVFGFPLPGTLSKSGNLVEGNITALSGLGDDIKFFQISAPIQPGNSGGPLLDEYGNIVGIVNAKLDELKWAKQTGSLTQNVNFAIKSSVLADFLDSQNVAYALGDINQKLDLTTIGERAADFTFQIVCKK